MSEILISAPCARPAPLSYGGSTNKVRILAFMPT